MSVSERDSDGWITVNTNRGVVRARAVIHTTNRWASHLLPEFEKLILPMKSTVAAIKAPAGFIKHTGAQQWDTQINVRFLVKLQYHLLEITHCTELPRPTTASAQRDHSGRGKGSACTQTGGVL